MSLTTRFRALFCCFGVVLTAGIGAGCGGDQPKAASGQKRLEIVHEPCAIDSGSAVKVDVNGDGNPDIIKVMSGGREVCRAIDLNFDNVKDAFIYFDASGNERRRESDFDKDGRPDEVAVREGGVLTSKELETNYDHKLDTWETYTGGKLTKAERDSDADGVVDEWWNYNRPDQPNCAIVTTDKNQDGEPDPDTAVDMCGEGYKAPPLNYTGASSTATATGAAPGAFPTSVGAAGSALPPATAKTTAPAPTPPPSASASAAPKTSASASAAPKPAASASAAPKKGTP